MFKDLISVLRRSRPDEQVAAQISRMIQLSHTLVVEAGHKLFAASTQPVDPQFFEQDRQINRIQQDIRKQLVGQLALSTALERAQFLVIINLIKDIERLGDYAKNLLETAQLVARPLPQAGLRSELEQIRTSVEECLAELAGILEQADEIRARELTAQGQVTARRCDRLVEALAGSELPANAAVPLALAARYYKRLQKHAMNVLSSLLMPLHKLDYFE